MPVIYLSLGSNIGEREKFLQHAIDSLKKKVDISKVSSFYLTEPWGNKNQASFINACIKGRTNLTPTELLRFIKSIESDLGRSKNDKWGPREIDIDIIFYGDETMKTEELEIPHAHLSERAFVLVPLSEIAPDLRHPALKKTIAQMTGTIDTASVKRLDGNE